MTRLLKKPRGHVRVSEPYESLHPSDHWYRCNVCLIVMSADLAGDYMKGFVSYDRPLASGDDEEEDYAFDSAKTHICWECLKYFRKTYIEGLEESLKAEKEWKQTQVGDE